MDRVSRLIAVLVVLLASLPAHAIDYVLPTEADVYSCYSGANVSAVFYGSSPMAACQQVAASRAYTTIEEPYKYTVSEVVTSCLPNGYCEGTKTTGCNFYPSGASCGVSTSTVSYSAGGPTKQQTCKPGSHPVGGGSGVVCACDEMHMKQGGECKQYTCPPSGSYSAVTQPDQKVSNAGDVVCTGGCSYTPSSWKVGQDGQIWATWPFKSSGGFCKGDKMADKPLVDSGEKNSKNPAPVPCGANQCPGTVNGATICVPCKGQVEQGPSTSASAPAGAASAGSGTSTTTTCDGLNCTTTTTVKDGSGNVTGYIEKTEKQESFCKENPQSSLCKQSSFSGSCSAISCDGDAVMCAIARDQHRRNCQWFEDPEADALKTIGDAAIRAGNGALQPDGHPAKNASEQSVSFATVIDQTDRLGGSCPTDVGVSVAGKSLVIPFSSMCGQLQIIGNLLVGFCMFVAVLIVFRS